MSSGIDNSRKRVIKKLTWWGATAINIPVDFATGTAVINFTHKGNNYSFRYKGRNGKDALAKLTYSLCRLIDCDVRNIFPFSSTAKEYLAISGKVEENIYKSDSEVGAEIFAELEATRHDSNDELIKKYKKLATMFHPDRAINEEDKKFYSDKMSKLNEAWTKIKKERGIQ